MDTDRISLSLEPLDFSQTCALSVLIPTERTQASV